MNNVKRWLLGTAAGIVVFIVTGVGLQFALPLAALCGLGAGIGIQAISRPQKSIGSIRVNALPENQELKKMMNDAYKDLIDIQNAYRKAKHPDIKQNAQRLYMTGVSIFEHLKTNPQKITTARRFLTYYLDTAAKIMNKYKAFLDTRLDSEDMNKVYIETNRGLEILNKAFTNQFNKLLQNEMMDIEADIKVLEQTLKMEE